MKKIFIFISLLISFVSSTYALNFDFVGDFPSYRRGEGVITINPLKFNIDTDSEINTLSGFSLIISDETSFRFSGIQNISIQGTDKIKSNPVVLPSMKRIDFYATGNFVKGDSFTISGINIIVYRTTSPGSRQIGLYNGLQTFWSNNNIRINDLPLLSSDISPSEVFNLTGSIVGDGVFLTGDNPGDPDFNNIQILMLDKNKLINTSFFTNTLNNYKVLIGNSDYIQLKTTNTHGLYSSGLTFPISYFDHSIQNNSNTGVVISSGATSTGVVISNTGTTDNLPLVSKYKPVFSKYTNTLNRFITIMDKYIDSKTDTNSSIYFQNQVTAIRNNIAIICEDLDKSTSQNRKDILIKLRDGVNELKLKLKK